MDLNIAAAASSNPSSLWSLLYQYSQNAFGQLFSLLNRDWVKGRPCTYGITVATKNGSVRGKTFTILGTTENSGGGGGAENGGTMGQRRVHAFLGIPYARAGTHQDRFKRPFPVEPWQEPLDCTRFGPRAIQYDMFWDTYLTPTRQDEAQCLHISVFAPERDATEAEDGKRPVIVFVHGGGFLIHSAANYGDWNICQNLCAHGVVVCIVQYRLGLLGFLSTGDERCPGNFGLWDQLAAFQWVKENIASFGGDQNNVTAFGQSAGAASIDLLSLSPLAKGLFKRVILMGGNASTDWAIVKPERTQAAAIRLAKRIGWRGPDSDLDSLLAFFRAMPAHRLAAPLIGKSAFNRHRKGLEFCPVIDGQLIPGPVEQLRAARQRGDGATAAMDAIIGGTEFEALLFLALGRRQSDLISLRKYLRIYIPDETPEAEKKRKCCEHIYLHEVDADDPRQMSTAFLRLHSDLMMNNSVQRYCHGMLPSPSSSASSSDGPKIFLYNMTHFNADEFGFIGLRMPFYAATHCHDLRYLLGKGLYSKFRPNWDDRHMMRIMGTLFTNFAKCGNPNGRRRRMEEEDNGHFDKWEEGLAENGNCPRGKKVEDKEKTTDGGEGQIEGFECLTPLWLPITWADTYHHLELCLEPKMCPDYQGRRYEFWRNALEKTKEEEAKRELRKF